MGKVQKPPLVKLVTGFIAVDKKLFLPAERALRLKFGPIDFESEISPFDFTDYYEEEIGRDLKRKFISFKQLFAADLLPGIKLSTNRLEQRLSRHGKRRINIDPGYITAAKLVLATTKDFYHRIFLRKGVFAEVTLFYSKRRFRPFAWTYPDYRTPDYLAIFKHIRGIYLRQIKG